MADNPQNVPTLAVSVSTPYKPTEQERTTIEAFHQRKRRRKPAPLLKLTESNAVSVDHPDTKAGGSLLLESLGLCEDEAYSALMQQIVNAATKGKDIDLPATNGMLAMIQALEPRDALEAMLATQMVSIHYATMAFARRLNHVDTIPQQDSASNAFNKLARTFTAQIEALNRYRGKGQQQVTVTHMHVHEGGQAIVAASVQGGGASKSEKQPHAKAVTHAPFAPVPCKNAEWETVPKSDI